jgi:acetyl esterase
VPELSPKLGNWLNEWNREMSDKVSRGYKLTAISAREELAEITRNHVSEIPPVEWINDELVNAREYAVPVRIYHPAPAQERPVIIYYHGGGFVGGSVSVYDPVCRKLAAVTGHIIVSVEYRLAPENPYPCGLIDAVNVACGVWDALDRRTLPYKKVLSIAGDSAGAGLASSVSSRAQFDHSLKIANQILIYPALDFTMSHPSIEENGKDRFLTRSATIWYFDNYFQRAEDRYKASPLYGDFTLCLPRTLVISTGLDPLRDEANHYVSRLRDAGVPHRHLHFDDMVHAFLNLEDLVSEECQKVYQTIAEFLNGESTA